MAPTLQAVEEARARISDRIVATPCRRGLAFEGDLDCTLWLKFENLQRTGSFKDRGALNRLLLLTAAERSRGVVTASAGNHAQAVAYHASSLGIPSTVVMPEHTPTIKVSNTRRHGARIILEGSHLSEAMEVARRLVDEEGMVLIHAYDDPEIVAGQGTAGLELLEQVPEMDAVIVPVGGGGLISGTALAVKHHRPGVKVYGVEAAAAPSARVARERGHPVKIDATPTIADGIAVKEVGDVTFPLIERYVDDLVEVGEGEIASAVLQLLERQKTVVEGAGAVGLAALLNGLIPVEAGMNVVVVLTGGNIDITMISRIIERGMVVDGRAVRLLVTGRDRPGFLATLTRTVADAGANVLDIHHRRSFADIRVGDVAIVMHLETRGPAHVEEVKALLEARGHQVREDR